MGQGHGHSGHSHNHGHAHGHSHAPASYGRAFAIGVVLNTVFVAVEATYGYLSGSMALVADAGHNLSDVLSLLIAWGASVMTARPASARFTYGFKSSSILAALTNAALLLVAIGAILIETIRRLYEPAPVEGMTMIIVAAIGVAINTGTALLFIGGRKSDINIRGAFLRMAADALIAWGSWGLLKDSVRMGLLAVPDAIDESAVHGYLAQLPGVTAVHDLHIWPMSTTETALTAHLVIPGGYPGDAFLHEAAHELEHRFHIGHTTLQVEAGERDCVLAGDGRI